MLHLTLLLTELESMSSLSLSRTRWVGLTEYIYWLHSLSKNYATLDPTTH